MSLYVNHCRMIINNCYTISIDWINWSKTSALEPCTINALAKVGSEDHDHSEIINIEI